MDVDSKKQFKSHKIYRWIALAVKIISLPLLQLAFIKYKDRVILPFSKNESTLGGLIAMILALTIYYSIIFILNRTKNFRVKTDLKKSIVVYIFVVSILFILETLYAIPLKNYFYELTNLGLKPGYNVTTLDTVNNVWAYIGISLGVTLMFSFVAKYVTFFLFKKVLSKQEVLDQI